MANRTIEPMEERLGKLEIKVERVSKDVNELRGEVREIRTGLEDVREGLAEVRTEMSAMSDRIYGVEDQMEALNKRLDVGVESLRGDFKLAFERIDSLREYMERSREEDRRERAADRGVLFALVRDHNRRIRAIERLEQRRNRHSGAAG